VQEIAPGIWCWQRRPRGLRPGEFGIRTSYAVAVNGETPLVDPLVDGHDDPALDELDDLVRGRVRILISKPFHTRSAEPLWRRYRRAKARIYGHPEVATRLGDVSGFEAVAGGNGVGGVARLHPIGSPLRSEQPIEIPARRVLFSVMPSSRRAAASCALGRLAGQRAPPPLVARALPADAAAPGRPRGRACPRHARPCRAR
jgi:hypothetical protein